MLRPRSRQSSPVIGLDRVPPPGIQDAGNGESEPNIHARHEAKGLRPAGAAVK